MRFSVITVDNEPASLARASSFTDEFAAANGLAADVSADLHIALDEALTNIINYGYTDDEAHEIQIQLGIDGDVLEARIEDDGRPFNPLEMPEPDRTKPLEKRRIGGLGIHFVRKLMSEVRYERTGRRNRLLLRKRIMV